jgi:lysine decarboxylase
MSAGDEVDAAQGLAAPGEREVETVELENLVGRVSANMILPYPPGVPLLMPGEMITEESRAVLDFLLMLCSVGRHYPGFETDIHGAKRDETAFTGCES